MKIRDVSGDTSLLRYANAPTEIGGGDFSGSYFAKTLFSCTKRGRPSSLTMSVSP